MNILVFNVDSKPQFIGGIKRVCVSLAHQWIQHGINVSFVCVGDRNRTFGFVAGIPQVHLPESIEMLGSVNKDYLCKLIQEREIDVLLRITMATIGRESTKRFEPTVIAQQWIELFRKL